MPSTHERGGAILHHPSSLLVRAFGRPGRFAVSVRFHIFSKVLPTVTYCDFWVEWPNMGQEGRLGNPKASQSKSEGQILNREKRQIREQRRGSSLFSVSGAFSARLVFASVKIKFTMGPA
jgi:hypothetical protein